jgi:hypothetical protein
MVDVKMERVFDRNMFLMFLAIMVGAVVVTYFVADIVNRSAIDTLNSQHVVIIQTMEERNENFTSNFLESSILLDTAREDRATGNYLFDLARLSYTNALYALDAEEMEVDKNRAIENCTLAIAEYQNSHLNFKSASQQFGVTKAFVVVEKYLGLLDKYAALCASGARLSLLRMNSSIYLRSLAENLTFHNDTVEFLENVSIVMDMFDMSEFNVGLETGIYEEIKEEIDGYGYYRPE